MILQTEKMECGLACLANIAAYHGYHAGIRELRERFPTSSKGADLASIVRAAEGLGFHSRALSLDLDGLSQLQTPCILHWNFNHFVVLKNSNKRRITIQDPARGQRTISIQEASTQFTGIALELEPTSRFEKKREGERVSLSQLTGRITGLGRAMGMLFLLSTALQIFVMLMPLFMQLVVDQVLIAADPELLWVLAAGFSLVLFALVVTNLLRGWAIVYLSSRLSLRWSVNVFAHLMRLPMSFFEKRHVGDIMSRMGGVKAIQQAITTSFVEAIIDGMMAIVTLVMMFVYSWKLAVISLGAVAIYVSIKIVAIRPIRDATEQQLVAGASQNSYLLESIRGMQSLKLTNAAALRKGHFQSLMVDATNQEVRLSRLRLATDSANQFLFGIERILVIVLGSIAAMNNVLSIGMLIAYLAYKDLFALRVSGLVDKWAEFRTLRVHGERLADVVLTEPEIIDSGRPGMQRIQPLEIEVRGIDFSYEGDAHLVLAGCTFTVSGGESVAVVGASGCGKTTLIKVMLGLLTPARGAVHVNGEDIRRVGLDAYRSMVGTVMQDDQLFAGSIAENISFGDQDPDLARVEEVARIACIHDEIAAMPMGYRTPVGDMGSVLSGGQKQRVILARALYRKPLILFLDEATSHLDVELERRVSIAIRGAGITRVIVAHRPETIASADRILVMEGGRVLPSCQLAQAEGRLVVEAEGSEVGIDAAISS